MRRRLFRVLLSSAVLVAGVACLSISTWAIEYKPLKNLDLLSTRISASPKTGFAPLAVSLKATSWVDFGAAYTTWEWDFGDGSGPMAGTASTLHKYATAGVYTVTATAVTTINGRKYTSGATATIRVVALYWLNSSGNNPAPLWCCGNPADCSSSEVVRWLGPSATAFDIENGTLYWSSLNAIYSCPMSDLNASPTTVLADGQQGVTVRSPTCLAVAEGVLYWGNHDKGQPSGTSIWSYQIGNPKSGRQLAGYDLAKVNFLTGLCVVGKTVYWVNGGTLRSAAAAPTCPASCLGHLSRAPRPSMPGASR